MDLLQPATLNVDATPLGDGNSFSAVDAGFDADLSTVAWVQGELRRSLEAAHKAMRRFVKEADAMAGSDVDAVDPAVLRTARQQLHQGVGALEMVGLSAAATLLRSCETVLQRAVAKPQVLTAGVVDHIERASFALLDYLSRMLAGKPVSALSLFPQYQAVQDAAGASRVHPADLWMLDWQWHALPDDPRAVAAQPDADAISLVERRLLGLMRGTSSAITQSLSDLCAGLGAGANLSDANAPASPHASTLWKLAAAVFEAQSLGLLKADLFSKRVASRLLAQLRIIERAHAEHHPAEVSERLAQDLLFFCAQANPPSASKPAPRLEAARLAYGLVHHVAADYSTPTLGRFDPAWIAQARKRVAAAKESWSAVAGGEMHRLSGLTEQFSLVGDSLKRLFRAGDVLATELQTTIVQTQHAGAVPSVPLAMEVATSLLYVDAALEDAAFDAPEEASRVERMAQRIGSVRQGGNQSQAGEPLEGWMEDLYRRVSDRQTMGSVVQELRASLSEVERLIDQYFRNPTDASLLIPVAPQLSAMRGVLSVLGMGHACAAILGMREDVDELVMHHPSADGPQAHPQQAMLFDRLAGNLGALGFLIDMLSVQPQLAKSLFVYDLASGSLNPVMGRSDPAQRSPVDVESEAEGAQTVTEQVTAAATTPTTAPATTPRLLEQAQLLAFAAMRDDVPTAEVARDLDKLTNAAQVADQPVLYAAAQKARGAIAMALGDAEVASARANLSDALVDFLATSTAPMGLEELEAANAKTAPSLISRPMVLDMTQDEEMRDIFLEEAREVIADAQAGCAELSQGHANNDKLSALTSVRRAFHTLKGSSRMVGLKQFGEAAWACEQVYNTVLAEQQGADVALLSFTKIALDSLNAWVADIAQARDSHRTATTIQEAAKALRASSSAQIPLSTYEVPDTLIATMPLAAMPELLPEEVSFDLNLDLLDEPRAAQPVDVATAAQLDADAVDSMMGTPHALDLLPEVQEPADIQDAPDSMFGIAGVEPFDLDLDSPATELPSVIPAAALTAVAAAMAAGIDSSAARDAASAPAPAPAEAEAPQPFAAEEEQVKVVGPLRIGIPLFNIYLNEADELSRRLCTELAEWGMELHRPVGESSIALAHSLAGNSATVGFTDLSALARALEHALTRSNTIGHGTREEGALFNDAADEIRRLLHQFAAGFLQVPPPELMQQLEDHEVSSAQRLNSLTAAIDQAGGITAAGALGVPELAAKPEVPQAQAPIQATPIEEAAELATAAAAIDVDLDAGADEPLVHADFVHTGTGFDTDFDTLGVVQLTPFVALPAEVISLSGRADDRPPADEDGDEIDAVDALDEELFVFFEEEGAELLPQLSTRLRDWAHNPGDPSMATSAMRTLHTLKGGARLAGAMRLGEMAHRLENRIEALLGQERPSAADIDALQVHSDGLARVFDRLRTHGGEVTPAPTQARPPEQPPEQPPKPQPTLAVVPALTAPESTFAPTAFAPSTTADAWLSPTVEAVAAAVEPTPVIHAADVVPVEEINAADEAQEAAALMDDGVAELRDDSSAEAEPLDALKIASTRASTLLPAAELTPIDWSRFAARRSAATPKADRISASQSSVRVRAPLLDRLVNQAGEVSITRSRIEVEVKTLRSSLVDLTDNLERLRGQLRDIELQGETQMSSRLEAAKAASQNFDPLEFDRFTRFQELTRMMAESVNDVATVQRTVQRTLEKTEDELAAQARLTRDLQDDLLRTRMVEFEGLSDRLYRVVRQAAKETGKQVRLDIVGGSIEVDRGVLDRMTASFEHLLRNSVSHGIELPEVRTKAGKDAIGSIAVLVTQDGNEVGVEFRDDGAGLNLPRIRDKAVASGLLDAHAPSNDAELTSFIFTAGFSTAEKITELAGRGVGMDVVRSDVNAIGGRIETSTASGQGTAFKLVLPLTTAVTQVVMLRSGDAVVAVPSTLVEVVRRADDAEVAASYASGSYNFGERVLQFFWLGALLQLHPRSEEHHHSGSHRGGQRAQHVVIIRSAQQRMALHVDEVVGNQEVVVKNLGPQLSRMPGLAGMTLLPSGGVALIYNPVALATLFGDAARAATQAALSGTDAGRPASASGKPVLAAPLVLVVDDSLTVRRVTQRLLEREGYRVALAKDGLDAIERLADERPALVLSDIEMPRMDGFDLVRNIRGDSRLRDLPVIMITSRIAQKHRDYAAALGVEHYLGKPYSEEDLLALIAQYTGQNIAQRSGQLAAVNRVHADSYFPQGRR
jgi:chemosensory pili system protein ChpA (sensor histidine kinase/response regulator)